MLFVYFEVVTDKKTLSSPTPATIIVSKNTFVFLSNIYFALISSHSQLIEIFTEHVRVLSDVEPEPFDWLGRSYSKSLRDLA